MNGAPAKGSPDDGGAAKRARFLLPVAMLIFAICLCIHLTSVAGIDPGMWVMVMHLVVLLEFGLAIMLAGRRKDPAPPALAANRRFTEAIPSGAPSWVIPFTGLLFAYAMANFVFFMVTMSSLHDNPAGTREVREHGHTYRLTESEYHQRQCWLVRGFSGHWLIFSWVALGMVARKARGQQADADESAPPIAGP